MKNIAVTGYFRTGSSAVLDYLEEFSNVSLVPIDRESVDYEHVLFYYAGGLFDLCNQLTHGNTIMGSDAAINRFLESMKRLNDNRFYWFGSYKHFFGDKFMEITYEFINSISVAFAGRNCNHCTRMELSVLKTIKKTLRSILKLSFSDIKAYNYVFDEKDVYLSLPSFEELVVASQKYTRKYMDLFPIKQGSDYRVFDHFIWPQQINDFLVFLDPTLKIIVVHRDVRDIFIENKYLTKKPYFPTNIHEFIDVYSRVVNKNINHPNVIVIQFEDMIYNYDKFEERMECEIGLQSTCHMKRKALFNPLISIENTQIFRSNEKWEAETMILSDALPELIYDFPYKRMPDINKTFSR